MAQRLQVFRCEVCGHVIQVMHGGAGTLVCCNQPMQLLTENTTDAAQEKHVPIVERDGTKVTVRVGSEDHPMEEKHYIEWIEVAGGHEVMQRYLKPGDAPQATFEVTGNDLTVRAYCNLHGLWRA